MAKLICYSKLVDLKINQLIDHQQVLQQNTQLFDRQVELFDKRMKMMQLEIFQLQVDNHCILEWLEAHAH